MNARVQKWGNSLAVRIPKSFARELRFVDGSPAEMTVDDGAIVIKPDLDKAWDLDALLAGVTDDNLHPAWETEAAAGMAGTDGDDDVPDGNGR